MVRVSVQDAFENFDDPVLTEPANNLLTKVGDAQSARFRERFGELFIDGNQRGGQNIATFEIVSVDQSVRESIATSVEAGFNAGLASANLDVDVKNAKATSSSHVEVRVHVFQNGSIDRTDQTMQQIMDKARNFPPTVAGANAAAYAVSLAGYKGLALPNDAFNFLDIQQQRDVLAEHAAKRFEFLTQRNSISYVRAHLGDFIDADDAKLADDLAKITAAINTIEAEASACLENAKACKFTPFDISGFPLPRPRPPLPRDGSWARKQPLPAPRSSFGLAGANNGKLYAVGGFQGNAPATTTEEYNPDTDSWATKAPAPSMPTPTAMVAAGNGKLYAVDMAGKMAEYDPATNRWTEKASIMLSPRSFFGLAAARNGKIYAVGGSVMVKGSPSGPVFDHDEAVPTVGEYDPANDSWTAKAPLPTALSNVSLAAANNGKLYAIGNPSQHAVQEYDPSTDSWAAKAQMPTVRFGFALAAADNGRLYAVGGTINGEDALPLVEEYDPQTNAWVAKAPMPTARHTLALAAAGNGKLYAVGGMIQFHLTVTNFANVEEFTP